MAGRFALYGASLALIQLAIGCSPSAPEANSGAAPVERAEIASTPACNAATPDDARLVVVFGDSLYAGYNLGETEGFAPALGRNLKAQGLAAQVVNAGVSGDTSAAGLQRLAFILDGLARKPDLVLVGLGGNDMLRGLAPQVTRDNLDAILVELKRRNIPAMLTGMRAPPNMGADYVARFDSIYPDLAAKYDVPLYPFFLDGVLGKRDMMLDDGVHPNARGVTQITDQVAPMVVARLRQSAGS